MSSLRSRLEASLAGAGSVDTWTAPDSRELPRAAPASEEACVELVRFAARDGLCVLPLGNGSRAGRRRPIARADFALSTRGLRGVAAYEPGDGTLTARAGTPLSVLAEEVRRGGHHLTPAVGAPETTTLGGAIADGASGHDRQLYGPLRHHVLGTRTLLASGDVTRSGGRLVKNVTGYDLHRLYCGSEGTLCLLLEATVRLFPLAEERIVLRATLDTARAFAAAEVARHLPWTAETLVLERALGPEGASPWSWTAVCAGRASTVASHAARLRELVPETEAADASDVPRGAGAAPFGGPRLRVGAVPGRGRALAELVGRAAEEAAPGARLRVQPGLAEAELAFAEPPEPRAVARLADALARIAPRSLPGFGWEWLDVPPDRLGGAARTGPALAAGAAALGRRLRDALDPTGVFAWDADGGT